MTWLSSSSIGRKVVMSVTGAALVLFLLFHATMNIFSITDALCGVEYYNAICEFLGANNSFYLYKMFQESQLKTQ